jgi:sulfoxide reductase heme-binding subunit YedZ
MGKGIFSTLDRRARERLISNAVHIACIVPLLWLMWVTRGLWTGHGSRFFTGTRFIEDTGIIGMWMLVLVLAMRPAAQLFRPLNWLMSQRRNVGLYAFAYAAIHTVAFFVLDHPLQRPKQLLRPYMLLGITAMVLLIPLAVTSTDNMIRRMGGIAWRRLHKLVYIIVPVTAIHYGIPLRFDPEALWACGVTAALLGYRVIESIIRWRRRVRAEDAVVAPS